jgi:hypothetical protein
MRTLKYIDDFLENDRLEELINNRDSKIEDFIKYKDCNQYDIFGYIFYINEKLGYNSSLVRFIDIIIDKIENRVKDNFSFDLDIEQLDINNITININNSDTSITNKGSNLTINIDNIDLDDIISVLNHELHHIFINKMGNKTNKKYFIVNDLIKETGGKTQIFLTLYYMAFKDELNSNIQMFHSQIGKNNIKTKDEFLKFLNSSKLYNVAIKMKNIDIQKYWDEICKEGYDKILFEELSISNIDIFLKKTSDFISNSGDEYIRKMSRSFL